MSDEKPPKATVDELAKELKASLARRRPRTWKPVLAAIVVSSLILAGLWWWLYPRGRTTPLQIIALDDVFTLDETPTARAQLLVPLPSDAAPRLSGYIIAFNEQGKAEPRQIIVKSDKKGAASVEWPVLGSSLEFFVHYVDEERRQGSVAERGRLFVWPRDAPLLAVDADETLSADELDDQALATLKKAAEEGWHIVYLALTSTSAFEFRKARGWLDDQVKLPRGPILGRRHYPAEESLESARGDLLKQIKSRFKGPMFAVVKSTEAAQTCMEVGLPTIVIGDAKTPTWAEASARLK